MDNPLTSKLGPLPVWAWGLIASAGLYGYQWYKGRSAPVVTDPTALDTSLPSNVSAGDASGGSGTFNSPGLPTGGTQSPQTVEAWSSIVADWLIGNGSPVAVVQSAFAKLVQIANGDRPSNSLTAQEVAVISQGIAHFGSPPGGPLSYSTSPVTPGPGATGVKYVVETHQFPNSENSRGAVIRFSDPSVATADHIQHALVATVNDPANLRYRAYYSGHGGYWPAKASIRLHVAKVA